MTQFASAMQQQVSAAMNSYMTRLAGNMSSAMGIDQSAFADASR